MNKMTNLTHRSIVRDGVFGKAYQTAVPNITVATGSTRELDHRDRFRDPLSKSPQHREDNIGNMKTNGMFCEK